MNRMTRVCLLVGGHAPIPYDHHLSVGAYLGLMADYDASPADDLRIEAVHYIAPDGAIYSHEVARGDAPRSPSDLASGPSRRLADLPRILDDDGRAVHCLLYGENADAVYPGVEAFFGLRSRFGDVFGGALGRHKWAQSLVAEARFAAELSPIPMFLVPVADGVDSPDARACLRRLEGQRCFVKSNHLHMSAHASVIDCLTPDALSGALERLAGHGAHALVQAFIEGDEYTCGCLRVGTDVKALPLLRIEVEPGGLDYTAKSAGAAVECTVVDRPAAIVDTMRRVSLGMHRFGAMGATSRSDFIVRDNRVHYLETNMTPGLHDFSPFNRMLRAVGRDRLDVVRAGLAAKETP